MLPEVDEVATVVVCEDDEATLELLCDHLTADRYRALAAPSASDALRLCHFDHPEAPAPRRADRQRDQAGPLRAAATLSWWLVASANVEK
jgi:hypothetical protein